MPWRQLWGREKQRNITLITTCNHVTSPCMFAVTCSHRSQSANTELAMSPGQWICWVYFHLWKYPWLPYSITLLWGTPSLRARDSSHCKPRGASSLSPRALTAVQGLCPPRGSSPTWYTHTSPLHTVQCTGLYLVFIHLFQVSNQGSNQAPGQRACSSSQHLPVLVSHNPREPECCSE